MRILKIVPQALYIPRGTPLSAYHRVRELLARRHHVDILAYAIGAPPPSVNVRVFRARGPCFCRTVRAGPSGRKICLDVLRSYLASGRPVVATDTLVHNQLLTSTAHLDAAGCSRTGRRLMRALTDPALAAAVAGEGKRALGRLCCKAVRDSAYEEIAAAVHAAGEVPPKHSGSVVKLAARTKSTRGSER